MDKNKRLIVALAYTLVFVLIFSIVNSYLLTEATEKPYTALLSLGWVTVSILCHDLILSFIMGSEGVITIPLIRLIKKKLRIK